MALQAFNTALEPQNNSDDRILESIDTAVAKPTTTDLLTDLTSAALIAVAQKDDVKNKVLDNAEKQIDIALDTQTRELQNKQEATHFDSNKEACECYGVDKTVPMWQQRLMRFWYNVLFVIYFLIASFTVAPITFIGKRIKIVLKKTWVVWLLAVVIYGIIISIPVIINFI